VGVFLFPGHHTGSFLQLPLYPTFKHYLFPFPVLIWGTYMPCLCLL